MLEHKMKPVRMIAIIVLVAGLGILIYGLYDVIENEEYTITAIGLPTLVLGFIFSYLTNPEKKKRKKKLIFHFKNVGMIFLILSPIAVYILSNYAYLESFNIDKNPYTHFNGLDPSTGMYVSWETQESQETYLWLGTSAANLTLHDSNSTKDHFHRVNITGLTPDTKYYYKVGTNKTTLKYHGPLSTFKTAPVTNQSFKIAIFSDSQEMWGLGHYNVIADLIAQEQDYAFVSCAGDLVQEGDEKRYWNMFLTQSESWGKQYPFVPVVGNHDYSYQSVDDSYYTFYYGRSASTNHFYYAFNWSNVQFVVAEIGDGGTVGANNSYFNDTEHRAWINQTFANGKDKAFRILVFHRNLWTSTTTSDWSPEIQAIAEDYNVSLVIFGHNHHYERIAINGHRYLCLGGGGGMQDGAFRIIPESEFLSIGPSLTKIYFNGDHRDVVTVSEENDVIDEFTLVKNGTKAVLLEELN